MIVTKTVAIADVEPGMRLAVAVLDDGGHVLLPAAAALTDGILQSLQRRGVTQLQIESQETLDPAVLAARREAIEQQLARLFRKAGEGAETMALHQAVLAFRLDHCA
jgi:hypothetical protein